ncbi:NUDIX hydrolase domain-like protein [Xylariaceae sp. FL0016]|nr:NUDIX hydrolase domain-like protein [Xylariaceae sp. FL0016]
MPSTLLPWHKITLSMSRAQYLRHLSSPQSHQEPADKLSVGVCMFQIDVRTGRPSVLLLRRSEQWSQDGKRGGWELPGGKVEAGDWCLTEAIRRTVEEETGLQVQKIMGVLQETRRTSEIKVLEWDDEDDASDGAELRVIRKKHLQLNVAVLVESTDEVALRLREHDDLMWAGFRCVEELVMDPELRRVVYQALAWAGEYLC